MLVRVWNTDTFLVDTTAREATCGHRLVCVVLVTTTTLRIAGDNISEAVVSQDHHQRYTSAETSTSMEQNMID